MFYAGHLILDFFIFAHSAFVISKLCINSVTVTSLRLLENSGNTADSYYTFVGLRLLWCDERLTNLHLFFIDRRWIQDDLILNFKMTNRLENLHTDGCFFYVIYQYSLDYDCILTIFSLSLIY